MTVQIQSIHIFSHSGERRTVRFATGAVNIITGRSATGKSSILDIITYCFGSTGFHVAAGVIRDSVQMYAMELKSSSGTILVARPAPAAGRSSSTQMHISLHPSDVAVDPEVGDVSPNHDLSSAIAALGGLLGSVGTHAPVPGRHQPLGVEIAHRRPIQAPSRSGRASGTFHLNNDVSRRRLGRSID